MYLYYDSMLRTMHLNFSVSIRMGPSVLPHGGLKRHMQPGGVRVVLACAMCYTGCSPNSAIRENSSATIRGRSNSSTVASEDPDFGATNLFLVAGFLERCPHGVEVA